MMKFFATEIKRLFTHPAFITLAAVFFMLTLIASVYYFSTEEGNSAAEMVYGVSEYENFDELRERITASQTALAEQNKALESAILAGASDFRLTQMRNNISYLETNIHTMKLLLDNELPFDCALQYGNFDRSNGAGAVAAFIQIAALAISLIVAVIMALMIPSEIKDGQAKLTLALPVGRMKYVLYKFSVRMMFVVVAFVAYVLLAMSVSAIFFPVWEVYIIMASTDGAICLSYVSAALLQTTFSLVTIVGCGLIGFAVSLLSGNKVASLLITLAACFSGKLFELIERMLNSGFKFTNYLLPCNLGIDRIFTDFNANPVWLALIVIAVYGFVLFAAGIFRFRRRDIMN